MDTNRRPDQPNPLAPDKRRLRVVIVSEVRFLREGLAQILERDSSVSVVGLCADLAEAVALSTALRPDIVLLDAAHPAGAAAVTQSLDLIPDLRIIALAVRETEEDIVAWAKAGVIGYVPSTAAVPDLVRLIINIHDGEQPCSGRVAAALLRRIAATTSHGNAGTTPFPPTALTARERQAAELIRTGLSDKEIARLLNISLATTKSHVHNLLRKLKVQRRGQVLACLRAYEQHTS